MADAQTFQVTNKKQFLALLKEADLKKDKLQSISGELGERIKAASENGHLNRGAFGLMLKLHRMEEDKRAPFLRSLDAYRGYADEAQLWGSVHVGDLDDMARQGDGFTMRSAADDQAGAEERLDAEAAQVAANTEAIEKGIKRLPTSVELADAFERGRIAFLDGAPGMVPDDLKDQPKVGVEYLRGWGSMSEMSVEQRAAIQAKRQREGTAEAVQRESDVEFDDATAKRPSRRQKASALTGAEAAGTYEIRH